MAGLTSKSWRREPRIRDAEVKYLVMAPFAVVAYIDKGNFIHVGIARCNPQDTWNEDEGMRHAAGRARLQYAAHSGLVPDRRLRSLHRRASRLANPFMITCTKTQFRDIYGTTP